MDRLVNRSLLSILATLLLAVLVAPDFARAEDVVERVVVRNRKFQTWKKFEVNPSVGFSLTNKLTSTTNFQLGLAYNFSETLALELRPGFAMTSFTSVADQVKAKMEAESADLGDINATVDDFENLWRMEWQALLLPRWTPIYGKINLVTEVPIHFQAYLTAGGGAVGLMRESLVYRQSDGNYLTETKTDFAVAGGGGLRFFIAENYLVKLELFDIAYRDEYRKGIDRRESSAEAGGSDPQQGAVTSAGLTNVLMFNLGASVVF